MGRRNGRLKGPIKSRQRQQSKDAPRHVKSPIPLDQMVIPTGRCGRKLIFATKEAAERALLQAQIGRTANNQIHAEKRYYSCDRCQGFHLTNREEYHEQNGR